MKSSTWTSSQRRVRLSTTTARPREDQVPILPWGFPRSPPLSSTTDFWCLSRVRRVWLRLTAWSNHPWSLHRTGVCDLLSMSLMNWLTAQNGAECAPISRVKPMMHLVSKHSRHACVTLRPYKPITMTICRPSRQRDRLIKTRLRCMLLQWPTKTV